MSEAVPLYDATLEPVEVSVQQVGIGVWSIHVTTGIVSWGFGGVPGDPMGFTVYGTRERAERKAERLAEKVRRHIARPHRAR